MPVRELSLAVDALKGLWSRGGETAATKWRLGSPFLFEHDEVLYREEGNHRFPRDVR